MTKSVLALILLVAVAHCSSEFCWKDSFGRGAGKPLHVCPPNTEKDGELCYPKCSRGYRGVGPICWANCEGGQKDTGTQCEKKSYGRGAGRPLHTCNSNQERDGALCYNKCSADHYGAGPLCFQRCAAGYHDDGAFCRKDADIFGKGCCCTVFGCCHGRCPYGYHEDACTCRRDAHIYNKQTYSRGSTNLGCGRNEVEEGGLCYDKPRRGYKGVGSIAWENCKGNTIDNGLFCSKKSYGRGNGVPMVCARNEDENGGLCYDKCKNDYFGVGPVCWGSCPNDWADCGAGCAIDKAECADKIIDMITETAMAVANIAATIIGASPATKGAQMALKAAKWAKKSAKLAKKIASYAIKIARAAEKRGEHMTEEEATQLAEQTVGQAIEGVGLKGAEGWEAALEVLENVDPTGCVAAARAFMHPKCDSIQE